jgi:hypothetical protein
MGVNEDVGVGGVGRSLGEGVRYEWMGGYGCLVLCLHPHPDSFKSASKYYRSND